MEIIVPLWISTYQIEFILVRLRRGMQRLLLGRREQKLPLEMKMMEKAKKARKGRRVERRRKRNKSELKDYGLVNHQRHLALVILVHMNM